MENNNKAALLRKTRLLDVTRLQTIQNFANSYGEELRGKPFSTAYIYKLLKEQKEGNKRKLPFCLVEIDGIQFIQKVKTAK